jgi:hypothetical protein
VSEDERATRELPPETVVIRGGKMKRGPMAARAKKDREKLGIYGLSCACLPDYSYEDLDDLARIAQMPQSVLRASTVGRIRGAGEGFDVLLTATEKNPAHATLKLPDPPTDRDWETIEEIFDEPIRNAAVLQGGEDK